MHLKKVRCGHGTIFKTDKYSSVLLDTVTGQAVLSVGDLEVDHIRHLALGPIAHLLELDLLLLLPTWQVTGHG